MRKGTAGFMKGMGTGLMVGMVAGVMGDMVVHSNKKTLKKKASKAVKAVGNIMDDVSNMMK